MSLSSIHLFPCQHQSICFDFVSVRCGRIRGDKKKRNVPVLNSAVLSVSNWLLRLWTNFSLQILVWINLAKNLRSHFAQFVDGFPFEKSLPMHPAGAVHNPDNNLQAGDFTKKVSCQMASSSNGSCFCTVRSCWRDKKYFFEAHCHLTIYFWRQRIRM